MGQAQQALTPDKPFFVYFAPGATHAPHQVPKEWIAKFKGKFDNGWDKLRERVLARQIKLGMVPPGRRSRPSPRRSRTGTSCPDDEKSSFARQMEVYRGFAAHDRLRDRPHAAGHRGRGRLDNTLVFYMAGDNGASAEGGMNGIFNEMTIFNGVPEKVQDLAKHLDDLGGHRTASAISAGWAVAGDSPFEWTKQMAAQLRRHPEPHRGLLAHGHQGEKTDPHSVHDVTDIAPTVLEAARLPEPRIVNGSPSSRWRA